MRNMMRKMTVAIAAWGFEWKPSSLELAVFGLDHDPEPLSVKVPGSVGSDFSCGVDLTSVAADGSSYIKGSLNHIHVKGSPQCDSLELGRTQTPRDQVIASAVPSSCVPSLLLMWVDASENLDWAPAVNRQPDFWLWQPCRGP